MDVEIPKSIDTCPDDIGDHYEKIDLFFQDIKKIIKAKFGDGPYFEKKVRGMYHHSSSIIPTDDYTHILLYKQKVVATVLETRTDSNFVRFDFFKNLENLVD